MTTTKIVHIPSKLPYPPPLDVVNALWSDDAPLVQGALANLADLCIGKTGDRAEKYRKDAVRLGGPLIIVKAMERHHDDVGVQHEGCRALANLALEAPCRGLIAETGGLVAVLRAMDAFPSVHMVACCALWNITDHERYRDLVVANGEKLVTFLIGAMKKHPSDTNLQYHAFVALAKFAASGKEMKLSILRAGGLNVIGNVLQGPIGNSTLVRTAAHLLKLLADELCDSE